MPRCPNPRCQIDYPTGTTQCTNQTCQCLLPEAIVAGRYRIETLIGLGGMGAVYRASDTFEMKQVAIKVLSFTSNSEDLTVTIERFRREARYARLISHKNIVPVLNFGQDAALLYLVMPIVTGGTLRNLLKGEQPLPIQQAQRYMNDLAAALNAIHSAPQQIVHRDIKPSNLLIHQDDGRLVVADFGIARSLAPQEKALTQRGWSLGTENYIAPEQARGLPEKASDIYAMGVVAYQIFTGLLPFQAIVQSNNPTSIPLPSTINPALPAPVDALILRAMDPIPQKRFANALDFANALNLALKPIKPTQASTAGDVADLPTAVATPLLPVAHTNSNLIVRTIVQENPCDRCGRENRNTSRFCRHCGHEIDATKSPNLLDGCKIGYTSDLGLNAKENEDMVMVIQGLCSTNLPPHPFTLFGVADGLRGFQNKTAGGHEASRLVVETTADIILPLMGVTNHLQTQSQLVADITSSQPLETPHLQTVNESQIEQWLFDALRQANQVLYHCNKDYNRQMASTLTTALLHKHHLYVASVGNSRVYHFNTKLGLRCISEAQIWTASNVEIEDLPSSETELHISEERQYQFLGFKYRIPINVQRIDVQAGDIVLLCTDGLWTEVHDLRIQELFQKHGDLTPQSLTQLLIDAANAAGGQKNISAIVAKIL